MIRKADTELKKQWQELFNALPVEAKTALKKALEKLRCDAAIRSQHCWKKHKAPMALYWKVISVYAGHLKRAINDETNP